MRVSRRTDSGRKFATIPGTVRLMPPARAITGMVSSTWERPVMRYVLAAVAATKTVGHVTWELRARVLRRCTVASDSLDARRMNGPAGAGPRPDRLIGSGVS